MSNSADFRTRMTSGAYLAGTFVKTPSIEVIDVLMRSGLDFLCLDAEHAPFDRASLNTCLALAHAKDYPVLVRVPSGSPENLLQALDAGATGIVVPHVTDAATAARIAKSARFGHGGRGYAGSTRWAGFGQGAMPDLLEKSARDTIVIAQIEDPEGVEAAEAIAATEGIDGLFLGPADLSVAYGKTDQSSPELFAAIERVGKAAKAAGKAYMTFVPNAAKAAELTRFGLTVFFIASEHAWMLAGAKAEVQGIRDLEG